jgi:hypothetical protein
MKHMIGFSALAAGALLLGSASVVLAHESYMDCFDNRDGTITCEAGYEDGSPPNDQDRVLLKDADGRTLVTGFFDAEGRFTFPRPAEDDFMMIFIGIEIGHTNRVNARDLIVR